jgi:lysophospholipase L1-like esterase
LAKYKADGSMEITETVQAAGRTLLNFVSRTLTAKSGVTMRALRNVRIARAWTQGYLPDDVLDPFDSGAQCQRDRRDRTDRRAALGSRREGSRCVRALS